MSNTDEGKPAGKSGRRSRKGESKKAEAKKGESKKTAARKVQQATPAPVQVQSPEQDRKLQPEPVHAESPKVDAPPPAIDEPVVAEPAVAVAAEPEPPPAAAPSPAEPTIVEPAKVEAVTIEPATVEPVVTEPARAETAIAEPARSEPATAELSHVSLQTIANAYRDYTRKSFEDFGSFFEQLSSARSLEKAMSVHTEFVKRAYETSVAESQKICELHNKLARQTFQPLQGLVGKTRETRDKS